MSDRPIQVGDLVQVVRWPCCGRLLGAVRTVSEFDSSDTILTCMGCGVTHTAGVELCSRDFNIPRGSSGRLIPVAWLKRIPPLSELESVQTNEKLKVSA